MSTRKVSVGAVSAVAVTAVVLNVLVAAVLITYQRIPNIGDVKAVGVDVYWDNDCTSELTSIDWGFLNSGATSNVTMYLKNEGNIPVVLNVTADNWSPASTSDHMVLSWNREGYVLNSNSLVQAVLTLSVSSGIGKVRSFSFDMTITGTEYA
jgi:hypothetical protein